MGRRRVLAKSVYEADEVPLAPYAVLTPDAPDDVELRRGEHVLGMERSIGPVVGWPGKSWCWIPVGPVNSALFWTRTPFKYTVARGCVTTLPSASSRGARKTMSYTCHSPGFLHAIDPRTTRY